MAKKKKQEDGENEEATAKVSAPNQPQQNGVTRPRSGTATGRIWEIADELSQAKGEPAPRAEVLKQAVEIEHLNPSTAATQYGRWRKFHNLGRYAATEQAADEATVEDGAEVEA